VARPKPTYIHMVKDESPFDTKGKTLFEMRRYNKKK